MSKKSESAPTYDAERLAAEAIKYWGINGAAEACRQWAEGAITPLSRHEWLCAAGIIEDKAETIKQRHPREYRN